MSPMAGPPPSRASRHVHVFLPVLTALIALAWAVVLVVTHA